MADRVALVRRPSSRMADDPRGGRGRRPPGLRLRRGHRRPRRPRGAGPAGGSGAEVAGADPAVRALGLEVARIEAPGTLDGGDVLQVGRTVVPVRLHGVLHLKSAVTALSDGTFVTADPSVFDPSPFPTMRLVP